MTRQFTLDLNDHRGNVVALALCMFVLVHKLEYPFGKLLIDMIELKVLSHRPEFTSCIDWLTIMILLNGFILPR